MPQLGEAPNVSAGTFESLKWKKSPKPAPRQLGGISASGDQFGAVPVETFITGGVLDMEVGCAHISEASRNLALCSTTEATAACSPSVHCTPRARS